MVHQAAPLLNGTLECHHAVVLATTRVSATGVRLPGSLCLVVCCHRVAYRSDRSGSRRRPCRVLGRRRSVVLAASFFCPLLCLRCSHSRVLTVRRRSLFRYGRSPRRLPSCWLALAVLRVCGLSFVRAAP